MAAIHLYPCQPMVWLVFLTGYNFNFHFSNNYEVKHFWCASLLTNMTSSLKPLHIFCPFLNCIVYFLTEFWEILYSKHFPGGSIGKESACNVGDLGSNPRLRRSPGEGIGYPLQYSGLENSMDCIVHGFAKSQTWLSDSHSLTNI